MLVSATEPVRRLRRIDETSLQPQLAPPIPPGISGASSIAPAPSLDNLYETFSRAFLPIPQPHYMIPILEVGRELSRMQGKEFNLIEGEIESDLGRVQALNLEKIQMMQLHTKELESKVKWSAWQTVTQYIAATTSIVIGSGCVATGAGAAAGAFLIASGALGLVNRVASDTGSWQWMTSLFVAEQEKQINIARQIDTGLSAVSLALSFGGTIGAYNAGVLKFLAVSREPILKAASSLGLLNSGLKVSMSFGGGLADKRQSKLLADLKVVVLRENLLREGIKMDTPQATRTIQLAEEIDRVLKNAISSLNL